MSQLDARMGSASQGSPVGLDVDQLVEQIRSIGLARFVGRINAGLVAPDEGYEAVERYVEGERRRPLLSRLGHILTGRRDCFEDR